MVNLTAMWVAAGKPEGRRPSNFKATAATKRRLACLDDVTMGWYTVGRGTKAETYASELLAESYRLYLFTPKRGSGAKAQAKAADAGTTTSTGEARYTEADMKAAYLGGYRDGRADGYEEGFGNGKRSAGSFRASDALFTATKQQCHEARKTFARKYHPDHNPGGLRDMTIINAVFDEIERIFNRAA